MRLLEFNKDEGGANPRRPGTSAPPKKVASVEPLPTPRQRTASRNPTSPARRGFPIKGNALLKPASPPPVDLEHLQERIALLETTPGEGLRQDRQSGLGQGVTGTPAAHARAGNQPQK